MANYACRNGHAWQGKSSLSAGFSPAELRCPECGAGAEPKLKQSSGRRNAVQAGESPVIAEAHARFTALVTEWPCWFTDRVEGKRRRPDHRCWGRRDPHHLIPASFIREHFGDLPDPELADILYAPIIGVPLCRAAHEAVERRSDYVYWHELDPELIDFCQRMDRRYPDRSSLTARLRLESPERGTVAA